MIIELISRSTGRSWKLAPKAFGKLLHLAQFHGWKPERLSREWPSPSWDTEIVLPHVGPYMACSVSKEDARGLAEGLEMVVDSESSGLDQRLYFAALGILEIAREGEFEVQMALEEV